MDLCWQSNVYINMNLTWVYACSPSWTALPPPSLYHPSGSSQCTSPKHPVSCIKPGLAIHFLYNIIHVSMPFSQICLGTKFQSLEFIIVLSLKTLALKLQSQCSQFLVVWSVDKNSGPQGPRRTPTMPQEEAAGKQTGHESHWAQVLLILLKISNVFFFTSVASVSVFL